jgi:hypothetical protein
MLTNLLKGAAIKRGTRVLPGGWMTMLALHPRSRRIGAAAARHGWRELQKRRNR